MGFAGMSRDEIEYYIQSARISLKTVERELSDSINAKDPLERMKLKEKEQRLLEELRKAELCLKDRQRLGK